MEQLWVRKYSPKVLDDILGNNKIIELSKVWLNKLKKNKHICNYLFFTGTTGIGKTITASLLLEEYGYDVHEYNSSNHEKVNDFKETLKNLSKNTNVLQLMNLKKQKPAVIIDEVCNTYKNKIYDLLNFISKNKQYQKIPIIIICDLSLEKKFKPFIKDNNFFEFKKPTKKFLNQKVFEICEAEKMSIDESILEKLYDFTSFDYRQMIIVLEELKDYPTINNKVLDIYINKSQKKIKNLTLFENVNYLLYNKLDINECYQIYENDKYLIPMMIFDNFPNYIDNLKNVSENEKLNMISELHYNFCDADLLEKYIYKNQHWELDEYHCISSIYSTNNLIHNVKQYNKKCDINFTTLLTQLSSKKFNLNFLNNIKEYIPLEYKNIYLFRDNFLKLFFEKNELIKDYLKTNEIPFEIIETLIKISKVSDDPYRKMMTSKNKKLLKQFYYE
jgi:DNA polymerase III delta prime subunit